MQHVIFHGEMNDEGHSLSSHVLHLYMPLVVRYYLVGNGKAEAGAALLRRKEGVEYVIDDGGVDAATRVGNRNRDEALPR